MKNRFRVSKQLISCCPVSCFGRNQELSNQALSLHDDFLFRHLVLGLVAAAQTRQERDDSNQPPSLLGEDTDLGGGTIGRRSGNHP